MEKSISTLQAGLLWPHAISQPSPCREPIRVRVKLELIHFYISLAVHPPAGNRSDYRSDQHGTVPQCLKEEFREIQQGGRINRTANTTRRNGHINKAKKQKNEEPK